jgi:hypothetical protein
MKYRWLALIVILCLAVPILTQQNVKAETNPQTASLETIATIALDKAPLLISIDEDNNTLLLGFEDSAMVIDGATKQVLTTFPVNAAGSYVEPEYDPILDRWVWNGIEIKSWSYVNSTVGHRTTTGFGTWVYQFVYGVWDEINVSGAYLAWGDEVYTSVNFTNTPSSVANAKTGELYFVQFSPNQLTVLQGPCAARPILITDISVNPLQSQIGETVVISFKVRNLGDTPSSFTPSVKMGDLQLPASNVVLAGKENRTITFTTNLNAAGYYTVTAEGLTANLTVNGSSEISGSPSLLLSIPETILTITLVAVVVATLIVTVSLKKKKKQRETNTLEIK